MADVKLRDEIAQLQEALVNGIKLIDNQLCALREQLAEAENRALRRDISIARRFDTVDAQLEAIDEVKHLRRLGEMSESLSVQVGS